ncbi:ribonuclease R family protein [Aliterella atlantica]|uniref:Iron ABC transporter substrate-binding protein n=1 Tax=Aliterella atlantica CENA595 TaxID=1618023 RepID=A0A0D8ZSZ6_9CYAN|nr:ribonuclease R family protein [Aliterella atlantica]KJH71860.1 iron ABC transporter substrate-binding protein [Aliterella atlantica CENA595]
MEFSIATLLANFTEDKLVAAKVLEKKLDCQDEQSINKLHIVLDVLEKVGILSKHLGKYRRLYEEDLIEAKLRCSSKGFCFAIQEEEGSEDIYIKESHLSTGWNGDRVLVKMTREGSRRRSPEGEVKLIVERSNHSLLARIKQTNNGGLRAVPLDDRLLFEIELQPSEQDLAAAIDHLVHVEIQRYPLAQFPPIGKVVQILGSDAETAADIDLVCCKHDLAKLFSPNVQQAGETISGEISKNELKQRLDLRSLLTLTITGDGQQGEGAANLIENAFTIEKTDSDNWQLGIHIADVAHHVTPELVALDRECLKRGSAVYLGKTVLPMLPEGVIERCALLPQSDRRCISVMLTIDANTGSLVEYEIQPSVIQVDRQLTEQQAEEILDGDLESTPESDKLEQILALSRAIRQQRLTRGSFELKLPPRPYFYQDEGVLGAVVVTSDQENEQKSPVIPLMLTELILLANQVVANHLQILGVPAIYRGQSAPEAEDVEETIKLAGNLGVELTLNQKDRVLPSDFQSFTTQFAESPSEQVLTYLLQATLKNATYSTTAQPHFGLALEQGYTRCTFPLRRYADLLIQRVLHAVFSQGRDRRNTRAKESVNLRHSSAVGNITWNVLPTELQQELEADLARVILPLNDREKEVQDAEDDLMGLQKAQLMKQRTGDVFQGLITGVQSYGFFVEIAVQAEDGRQLQVEGLVHVSSLKDDWYEYRARLQALFGRKNRASYRLGDRVEVQVKSVDYYRQQIDLVTVSSEKQTSDRDADLNVSLDNGDELDLEDDLDPYTDDEE